MPSTLDSSEAPRPLADYFWIAGIDGKQLSEAYSNARWSYDFKDSQTVGASIREEVSFAADASSILQSPRTSVIHSRPDSFLRLSELSDEARDTVSGLGDMARPPSSQSGATIKAPTTWNDRRSTVINEVDFEQAMEKFTSDRDTFFLDLSFDLAKPERTKSRPQTQRIVATEQINPLPGRNYGSIRRHLSFKDLSSVKRQTSMAHRVSTRTSHRMSSYNSVIPAPESFRPSPNQHPLARKFEPVLLDRYPRPNTADRATTRGPFPEYVPMFAFPGDIKIITADTRPKSTWHEFCMTASDNSRITAVSMVIWIPVSRQTAIDLERKCEEWRNAHMSEAEKEMASSLGERLTIESAKLSSLLAQLPQYSQGSYAREHLEEEISAVEEKIGVMSEMLRPLQYGTSANIQGLAGAESRFWIPRAYGILGKDASMATFWRQWLRAIVVPMMDGGVLRVPASSPKVGMWQPLERYVAALCMEAQGPVASKIQVQLSIRELHLYAKKEAANELPGSRTTDLYPLFRALSVPNVVLLFEYVLAESRIILLSSHTSMLQLVAKAILELIWPLKWAGVYIPVLPQRLIQALDAPCPYICGVDRNFEKYELPDDDYVLVDLDKNELHSTEPPPFLPKQQRRKLLSLLNQASPIHHNFGVTPGPPPYAVESYPQNAFSVEFESNFTAVTRSTELSKLAGLSSTSFGQPAASDTIRRAPILNAFLGSVPTRGKSLDRPGTGSTFRKSTHTGSDGFSPIVGVGQFPTPPGSTTSRNDSGYGLQTSLREKLPGHFDSFSKRSFSGPNPMTRKASIPFVRHQASPSTSTNLSDRNGSSYAASTYAQSTIAASTIMPGMTSAPPARNTEGTLWVEGHHLQWRPNDGASTCVLCDEKAPDGFYRCTGCGFVIHDRCAHQVTIVCIAAFFPDQVRAAFVRCLASLFYTYRRFMLPALSQKRPREKGTVWSFDSASFIRSLPDDHAAYIEMLQQTQAWNEFIQDREENVSTPSIALFDAIINAKRGRAGLVRSGLSGMGLGRKSYAAKSASAPVAPPDVLSDTSAHLWRVVPVPGSTERAELGPASKGRDYHTIITRTPAKLEEGLFKQEEHVPNLPSIPVKKARTSFLRGKLNGLNMHSP